MSHSQILLVIASVSFTVFQQFSLMLWIAHHHFTDDEPLNFTFLSQTFAINETVYIMYLASSGKEGFPNFDPPTFLTGCFVVDKQRVLIWNAKDRVMYEGHEAKNVLNFREIRTTGDVPHQIFGFAYSLYKGSLIIYGGLTFDNVTSTDTYEINLETFAWSKRKTKASQELKTQLSEITEYLDADNLVIGDRMHVIGRSLQSHFVLNLSSNEWKKISVSDNPEMPLFSNKFVSGSHLFAYGRNEPNEPAILYKFNERKEKWKEVLSSPSHRLPRRFEHVTVAGKRVYFMKDANLGFQITTLVSVLETDPSIFQRSAPALRSSRFGRSVVKNVYPKSVNEQVGQSEETRKECFTFTHFLN